MRTIASLVFAFAITSPAQATGPNFCEPSECIGPPPDPVECVSVPLGQLPPPGATCTFTVTPVSACLSVSGAVLNRDNTRLVVTNTCEVGVDAVLEADFAVDVSPLTPGIIASAMAAKGTVFRIRTETSASFVLTAANGGCALLNDQSVCF